MTKVYFLHNRQHNSIFEPKMFLNIFSLQKNIFWSKIIVRDVFNDRPSLPAAALLLLRNGKTVD